MQTVLEFNNTLNTLEVEIAGLQAKVSANKEYMAQAKLTNEALTKLQQILADHIIELAGALARKETATKIRDQAKEFYDLNMQLSKLPKSLDYIQKSLSSHERGLEGAKEEMISPAGGALRRFGLKSSRTRLSSIRWIRTDSSVRTREGRVPARSGNGGQCCTEEGSGMQSIRGR